MSLLREVNYLFDYKLKLKLVGMVFVILLGSIAELLGVAIILPIIELATDSESITTNKYCQFIMGITGETDARQILLIFIVLTIGLYVVKNLYLSWMSYMMNRFSKNTRMLFSVRLMESYMKQPYSYFLQKNTAEILRSVINDTVNLYAVIANTLQVISQGMTVFLIIVFLAFTNFVMTIVVAIVLGGATILIVLTLQKKLRRMGVKFQRTSAGIVQSVKQSFEGIKEVKITNKERYFVDDFSSIFNKATKIELVYNLLSAIPKYVIETICIGGIMAYLAIAIILGENMTEMLPQLSVFAMGAFKLLPSINALYASFSNILYNKASIDLIYHDIREVEKISDKCLKSNAIETVKLKEKICVEQISFRYDNADKDVLTKVSLEIRKGESVAFVGESGSGKTTLVDIILGILYPYEGEILVDGMNIVENLEGWHRGIGYIPQMIFLLDDTIRKNVAFGIPDEEIDDEAVWRAIRDAKLYEFVKELELGLDTKVGEAGTRLSGGQRQRIGIARALYYNPEILVFDEATSALDTETEREVMEAINGLHGMKTMLMIAHRLSTIEGCDHVYCVSGKNIEQIR